jgi:transcription elongation factor GreB
MSRGFVKEDDLEHAGTDVPERSISTHPNYVTVNGYAQLEKEANALELQRKALSAKKDDQQAQQQLAIVNRDLRYVAARLESALLTDEGNSHTYAIVGEDEADIKANKVSWTSPLAKALIGHKLGETAVWARPAGNITLEIIAINYC